MDLKKRLCNPPAQETARAGDPLVLGYFLGAGAAVDILPADVRDAFLADVIEVETRYMEARASIAEKTVAEMKALVDRVLASEAASKNKGKGPK